MKSSNSTRSLRSTSPKSSTNVSATKLKSEYLYSVKAVKDYAPEHELEIYLFEGEIYYVSEETDKFLYIHSRGNTASGYAPSNYLKRQAPVSSLIGYCIKDYEAEHDEEMSVADKEKLIIVATQNEYAYCTKVDCTNGKDLVGKVPLEFVYVEGDLMQLPTLSDYLIGNASTSDYPTTKSIETANGHNNVLMSPTEEKKMLKLIKNRESQISRFSWLRLSPQSIPIDDDLDTE